VGLCTDSNAQLPPDLAARWGVEIVPLTVTVDGADYLEGEDLSPDEFYERFEPWHTPVVATAAPAPGRFVEAYRRLAEAGVTEILAVHLGASVSGTVASARLAAELSPVPVRVVDTGTASFGITCCLWAAADALANGAGADEAAAVAEGVAATVRNVFVVRALDLAHSGGRLGTGVSGSAGDEGFIPVMSLRAWGMEVVGRASTVDDAVAVMVGQVDEAISTGGPIQAGVGFADAEGARVAAAIDAALAGRAGVDDLVRFRIAPSAGAHTGPGTAGVFWFPRGAANR
jgi:DegV family protein with EDD domain